MMRWMYDLQMNGIKEGDEFMLYGYINNIAEAQDGWYIARVNATRENILGHMVKFKLDGLSDKKRERLLLNDLILHCVLERRNTMCHVLRAKNVICGKQEVH